MMMAPIAPSDGLRLNRQSDLPMSPSNAGCCGGRIQKSGQASMQKFSDIAKNDAKFEDFAFALTGKTAAERTPAENRALKQLRQEMLEGKIAPEFVEADKANGRGGNKLPCGAGGSYKSCGEGKQGRATISGNLRGKQLQKATDGEMGNALVDRARQLGIGVADGDAGARVSDAACGCNAKQASEPMPAKMEAPEAHGCGETGASSECDSSAEAQRAPQTQDAEVYFKPGDGDQMSLYYKDPNTGDWIKVADQGQADENGLVQIKLPPGVGAEDLAMRNESTGTWYSGSGSDQAAPGAEGGRAQVGFGEEATGEQAKASGPDDAVLLNGASPI
jgi:hypothetical protein